MASGNGNQKAPRKETSSRPPGPGRGPGGPHGRFGPVEKAKDAKGTMLRLWVYVWAQRKALVWVIILVAIGSGLGVLGPWMMGRAIDLYITQGDLHGLGILAGEMVGVYAVAALATWFQSYVMAAAAQQSIRELRQDLFRSCRRSRCGSSTAIRTVS